MTKRNIYHVVLEYWDMPTEMSGILKTFSSRKKAEDFRDEYRRTHDISESGYDCISIEEYEVE